MAIRFTCPSCSQPIETDDAWANQAVACPYCRNVVTAPARSTWPPAEIPMASPVVPAGTATSPYEEDASRGSDWLRQARPGVPAAGGGRLATWALTLALLSMALSCMGGFAFLSRVAGLVEQKVGPQPTTEEVQRAWAEIVAEQHAFDVPPTVVAMFLMGSLSGLLGLWLAVLSLIRQENRRVMAVMALILSTCFTFCQVVTLLAGLMQKGVRPG